MCRCARYRATLAYDGTAYHGFQRQANASPTVQGVVEEGLARISGERVHVIGAGRTDAGVHATGQVIAFDLDWRHSADDLRNALNANLPADVAVWSVEETTPDFHPRYDARRRTYVYELYVAPVRNPLRRWRAWHLHTELDVDMIRAAAASLIGEHDFSTFGVPPQGESAVRHVFEANWETDGSGEHRFTITANAFLFRMVRSIVGTLVLVGQGRMTGDDFRGILAARDRSLAGAAAPAHGLTLVRVDYND